MARTKDDRFTHVQQVRMSEEMRDMIDAWRTARMAKEPALRIERSDAIRMLLDEALRLKKARD